MEFRLATANDLTNLIKMYTDLINKMNEDGIEIWDDIYPCEFFADDIAKKQLYILVDENNIAGGFMLSETNAGEKSVKWKDGNAKAMYVDRLGVNIAYARQGIATQLLNRAVKKTKEKGASYLRLFVIDLNTPAIHLYEKNGFMKAEGTYIEVIDETLSFNEYGYEVGL